MAKQLNEQAEQIQKLEETVPADVLYNQNPRLINYYYSKHYITSHIYQLELP